MRRWKKWTLVAVGFGGNSGTATMSRVLANEWNKGPTREWFWTQWGATRAARFYTQRMTLGLKPVHADELEASLAELAARS